MQAFAARLAGYLCTHLPQPLCLLLHEGAALGHHHRAILVFGGLAVVAAAAAAAAAVTALGCCRLQGPQAPPRATQVALEERASRYRGAAPALRVVHRLACQGEEPEGHRRRQLVLAVNELLQEVVDERQQAEPLQQCSPFEY